MEELKKLANEVRVAKATVEVELAAQQRFEKTVSSGKWNEYFENEQQVKECSVKLERDVGKARSDLAFAEGRFQSAVLRESGGNITRARQLEIEAISAVAIKSDPPEGGGAGTVGGDMGREKQDQLWTKQPNPGDMDPPGGR